MSQVIIDALKNQLKLNHAHNAKIYDIINELILDQTKLFQSSFFPESEFPNLVIKGERDRLEFYSNSKSWPFLKFHFQLANDWHESKKEFDVMQISLNFAKPEKLEENLWKMKVISKAIPLEEKEEVFSNYFLNLIQTINQFKNDIKPTHEIEKEIRKIEENDLQLKLNSLLVVGSKFIVPIEMRLEIYINASWEPYVSELEIIAKTDKTFKVKFKSVNQSYEYEERVKKLDMENFAKKFLAIPNKIEA